MAVQLDEEALAKRPELENISGLRIPQLASQGVVWLVLDPAISKVAREFNAYRHIPFGWRKGEVISQLAMHLSTRKTTHVKDEPICIATVLGLDVEAVLAFPVDRRMEYVFLQLEQVPSNILFSMRPHHKTVGLRWIPKSFLWDPGSSPIQSTDLGQVTDLGLVVGFPGWLFKGNQEPLPRNMQNMQTFSLRPNEHTYAAEIRV
jgi:hypothetical protein